MGERYCFSPHMMKQPKSLATHRKLAGSTLVDRLLRTPCGGIMRALIGLWTISIISIPAVFAQPGNIVTGNGGNDRSNANLFESQLSPSSVSSTSFGKIGALPVDGQVYAQ